MTCKCDPVGSGEEHCTMDCALTAAEGKLYLIEAIANQLGGWCSHGVVMERPFHPRCSNCLLIKIRAILRGEPT